MQTNNNRTLALVGVGALAVGVFLPLVRVPKMGTVNYFNNGSGDGVFVLVLAGIALALALNDRVGHVLWPGLLSLALIGFSFFRLQSRLSDIPNEPGMDSGIAAAARSAVQMEFGWIVLIAGAGLLIYAGVKAKQSNG